MIKVLAPIQSKINFKDDKSKANKKQDESHIVPNNVLTRLEQSTQKTMSAFIDYPAKGLRGDVNANFYEFLTMGIVPYILGSAVFMAVFGLSNKTGKKLSLGVLLCAALKSLSKNLVTEPVKLFTGIDTEMPYQNKVCNLPKYADEDANIEITLQQRKVFDSKEFYRKDLLVKGDYDGKEIDPNADKYELSKKYFDMVAKKVGLGENLNDSMTEASPIIQNIVSTSNTAKSLSSYSWAALGVCLATQNNWIEFFNSIRNREKFIPKQDQSLITKLGERFKIFGKNTIEISKTFCKSFGGACKSFWQGKGRNKHAGKAMTLFTVGLTTLLTANTILRAKNMAKNKNKNTFDNTKESTVI